MDHPDLRRIAGTQDGLFAVWQLRRLGWTHNAVAHRTRGMQQLHDGVYLTGEAPPTTAQRWRAATLTAPGRALSRFSAAAAWEIRRYGGADTYVTAPGDGGPVRRDGLVLCRSSLLLPSGTLADVTTLRGMRITTPERTVADLWPRLYSDRARRKLVREAIRLQRTTPERLLQHLAAAPARNAPRALSALLERYIRLGLDRCRSDAEAYAVELIDAAGFPLPQINVLIAGEEADLSWPALRRILEIDGGAFHTDKAEDARKTAAWTRAAWRVERTPAATVFETPARFIDGVRAYLA